LRFRFFRGLRTARSLKFQVAFRTAGMHLWTKLATFRAFSRIGEIFSRKIFAVDFFVVLLQSRLSDESGGGRKIRKN